MFGFHAPELIIILVIALLIFGPKKLPEMGSSIGRSIREFQKGMKEVSKHKEDEDEDDEEVKPTKAKAIERESVTLEKDPFSGEVTHVETHESHVETHVD